MKEHNIELFRKYGFVCFPIKKNHKIPDYRYAAERTDPTQKILESENYGILPTKEGKNGFVDLDDKERYRKFAEDKIKEGYKVIETPHGWHVPFVGLKNYATKTELFDYSVQKKKIIEIQGYKQCVVGPGSIIFDDETNLLVKYEDRGTNKIWDLGGTDFHELIDYICKICNVVSAKKKNSSSYKYLRTRFINGEIPLKGSSNDYYYQAGLICNTENLSKEQALARIRIVYDKWGASEFFSDRPWSNIVAKVNDVYENDAKVTLGRPSGSSKSIDRKEIASEILETRKIYADVETHDIYENKNGFLERINNSLKQELYLDYPNIERADHDSILFKLEAGANPMPSTNKDLIVFKNEIYDKISRTTIISNEIADMGFRNYNYLPKSKENEPTEFMKVLYDNVPKNQHKRINAGLRAIFGNRVDPKISVIYGCSGTGKSTPLNILSIILGDEYAYPVELNQFLEDRATRAHIRGKRLVVFQDLPEEWKDFTIIKTITGESKTNVRGFQQDNVVTDNKIKIWASGNYLADIPKSEKDAMYTRRLSLIHNTRVEPYKEDPEFAERIIKNEAEKIISWILNLSDEECEYEDKATVKAEWEGISSPEIAYLKGNWQTSVYESRKTVMAVIQNCCLITGHMVEVAQMIKSLKSLGYVVKNNVITNIEEKTPS